MEKQGFIREKLDIKILILYFMSRLPYTVDRGTLDELCQKCDEGIEYFDYSDCVSELVETGHLTEDEDGYRVTDKGIRNAQAVESSLPYSVRARADRLLETAQEQLARAAMITASYESDSTGCMAHFSLSDGVGEVLHLDLLCSSEAQARQMKRTFRRNAESCYQKIVELLTGEKKG